MTAPLSTQTVKDQKQIIVIHPSVYSVENEQKLIEAGYVVIVGDPKDVRVVVPSSLGVVDPLARAAFEAIASSTSGVIQQTFAKAVCKILVKKSEVSHG